MGYSARCVDQHFVIEKHNLQAAFYAAKNLKPKDSRKKGFKWVTQSEVDRSSDLSEVLRAWGWETEEWGGGVSGIDFTAGRPGEEEYLWEAIAPYVEPGCYIEMQGEDGYRWRWVFEDGEVVEQYAHTVWE